MLHERVLGSFIFTRALVGLWKKHASRNALARMAHEAAKNMELFGNVCLRYRKGEDTGTVHFEGMLNTVPQLSFTLLPGCGERARTVKMLPSDRFLAPDDKAPRSFPVGFVCWVCVGVRFWLCAVVGDLYCSHFCRVLHLLKTSVALLLLLSGMFTRLHGWWSC